MSFFVIFVPFVVYLPNWLSPRNQESRHAPTGLYGLGFPLNDKPGIVQILFIINQRFCGIMLVDAGAGIFRNGLTGSRIPFHGRA